jgi:hypothetical protein
MLEKTIHIAVSIVGTRPLLMHRMADSGTTRKRGAKVDPQQEAEAGLYKNETGIFIPAFNVLSCLKASARDFKVPGKGRTTFSKYIVGGVLITPDEIPLISESGWVVDLRNVVVGKSRIVRARPRFDDWRLDFEIEIVDEIITPEALREILEAAGQYVGLCDFRPIFGRFRVHRFEVL